MRFFNVAGTETEREDINLLPFPALFVFAVSTTLLIGSTTPREAQAQGVKYCQRADVVFVAGRWICKNQASPEACNFRLRSLHPTTARHIHAPSPRVVHHNSVRPCWRGDAFHSNESSLPNGSDQGRDRFGLARPSVVSQRLPLKSCLHLHAWKRPQRGFAHRPSCM